MAVPYTFGSATTSIPLSQLDSNFATTITLGNTAVQLGNTITTLTGVTNLASSGALTLGSNGNTTAITVDTSQNVGIGTASPDAKLSLKSPSVSGTQNILTGVAATSSTDLFALTVNQTTDVTTIGTPSGYAAPFAFQTNGTERMRIDSSGNVGIGTTSPSATLHVRAATDVNLRFYASGGQFILSGENNAGSANIPVSIGSTVFYVGSVYSNTTASAANVNVASNGGMSRSTSALKYKQDIRDLESIDITKFRPVRYKSKCEMDDQTKDHFGIVADEVDVAGIKELVNYGDEGEVEGFQYERLTVVLLKSLQELKAINDTQAETINALTARIVALESK